MSCREVTINPWQNSTIGYDSTYADKVNAEYIKASSPLLYLRIVHRDINLDAIELNSFSEREYLDNIGKLDSLYEEGEKKLYPGEYRVYGAFEIPTWAQELGSLGMTENEDIKINFNVTTLNTDLGQKLIHIGDVIRVYTSLYGWKYYEVTDAKGNGNFLGQYLMWQIEGKKTDLAGYIEENKSKAFNPIDTFAEPVAPVNITVNSGETVTPVAPVTPPPNPAKPKPKVY